MLTIGEAAKLLGVYPDTLRRWDKAGKLPAKRHPINGYRLYDRKTILDLRRKILTAHKKAMQPFFDIASSRLLSHFEPQYPKLNSVS
jgi:excisionase family DNA binding protein